MIGATIGSALLGASSANRAANAQRSAAQSELALQERIYDENVGRFEPFRQATAPVNNILAYELGYGDMPEGYGGFTATPGYDFRMKQGQQAIDGSAASRGMTFSGQTLKSQQQFGQGLASEEYNNYMNRLTGQQSVGLAAAGNQANAGNQLAVGGSNAYAAMGNASSAGAIGVGNALQGGIGNAMGIYQYQNMMNGGGTGINVGGSNSLFGGNSWG